MPGVVDLIAGAISGLGETAIKIRTAITGLDPAAQARIQELTLTLEAQAKAAETGLIEAQAQINLEDAKQGGAFRANWRPFVGWVCACGLALMMLVKPLAQWVLALAGAKIDLPNLDTESLLGLLIPLLGLGAYRTYEKTRR